MFEQKENRFRETSSLIYQRGCAVIPGGVNSPVRAAKGLLSTPLIVERGKGARVWDVDGNVYLDCCMSWGALILGHADPLVVAAACKQVEKGSTFGIATRLEV
ncbi:MAG TPA: aminotransferase class III-fold pyridoxal phosphate-dependent enzyme, partial [Chlamydiales bacterium]|nr:aminotransferase class III-fold pyridoxal phosphate-dependent enzyme [Chlamydiales bacterium]